MATTSSNVAVYLSPSPTASSSILSEPNINLKVYGGTQPGITSPHNFSDTIVNAWDEKYNRRTIPVVSRRDLDNLIAGILHEDGVHSDAEVESRLSLHLERRALKSDAEMYAAKVDAFMDLQIPDKALELLSLVRSFTIEGQRQFVVRTLAILRGGEAQESPRRLVQESPRRLEQGKAPRPVCKKRVNKKKPDTSVRRSKRIRAMQNKDRE